MVEPSGLHRILNFFCCEIAESDINHAIEFSSLESMRKLEASNDQPAGKRRLAPKNINNPDSFKVRRGKVGGYRDYFSAQELAQIEDYISRNLTAGFGYTAAEMHSQETLQVLAS